MKKVETGLMRLKKNFLETGPNAGTNWAQIGCRRGAFGYALAGIKRVHDANLEKLGSDPFNFEMEGTMRAWVAETLLQGAYLREFHLWEKDCKAYFVAMRRRNTKSSKIEPKKCQRIMDFVRESLALFSVTMPQTILRRLRKCVNA